MSTQDMTSHFASVGARGGTREVTFLPDPEPRDMKYTIISVDDHVVEPPDLFDGRMPQRFASRAPRVIDKSDGTQVWTYEGEEVPNVGMNAVVGRPVTEWTMEPTRFDEMRRGAWDPAARVQDMDLAGVYASLNFPSFLPGFCGQRLQLGRDPEFAMALVRAYNTWHAEAWVGPHRNRFISCQVPWLLDPEVAAAEIRQNAEAGFQAVTFSEAPHKLGLPTLHTGYWDPFFAACEETGTVVCLHIGSSSTSPVTAPDVPPDAVAVLFGFVAAYTAVDWLYSMVPVRFPGLKIALSEGGIGWVPALLDRLEHSHRYGQHLFPTWQKADVTPMEALHRNFWFCALEDRSAYRSIDVIGSENVMLEMDYPHADGLWPFIQDVVESELGHLPEKVVQQITWRNASELFDHEVVLGRA